MEKLEALQIIYYFYPERTPLRDMLMKHNAQVRQKALEIAAKMPSGFLIDLETVINGAMLHDIGIIRCHAPKIFCEGALPYIAHGITGAEMLKSYGEFHGLDLAKYCRICERHTGSGISIEDIRSQNLPIPEKNYLPETREEKLICLADKFYSKSGDMKEKSLNSIRRSMMKFGSANLERFDDLCRTFFLDDYI